MANLDLCAGNAQPIYPPAGKQYVTLIPLDAVENGTYTAPAGFAYSTVTVNVGGSRAAVVGTAIVGTDVVG